MKATEFLKPHLNTNAGTIQHLFLEEIKKGNCLLEWSEITSTYKNHTAKLSVSSDAIAIGEPNDWVRINLTATCEQQIADFLGVSMITSKISNLIYKQADVKLTPCTQNPDKYMELVSRMIQHHNAVEEKRDGKKGLISTVGKDWVLSNLIVKKAHAINHGWQLPDGKIIQNLGTKHNRFHIDYSQVGRFVKRTINVDGQEMDIRDVLVDPVLSYLISDEGPLKFVRYVEVPEDRKEDFDNMPAWKDRTLSLGQRAVLFSLNEMKNGVCETPPGSNTSPRIKEYLAPTCRRKTGEYLHLSSGNWCAASANFAANECAFPYEEDGSETIPHGYYASGIEIEEAAKANQTWRDISLVKSGTWFPEVGDLVILERDNPTIIGDEWIRHVCRVEWFDKSTLDIQTIGGNEGGTWHQTKRNINDNSPSGPNRKILGFVEYPRKK